MELGSLFRRKNKDADSSSPRPQTSNPPPGAPKQPSSAPPANPNILLVPCAALLQMLPANLKGPAFPASFPADVKIPLAREPLLKKLRQGKLVYSLGDFLTSLPSGWVQAKEDAQVELNLGQVVRVIPPNWMASSARISDEAMEAARLKEFFAPRHGGPAAEPGETPVAATPEEAKPAKPRRVPAGSDTELAPPPYIPPNGWDGYEARAGASPATVDINRASAAEMELLRGAGKTYAARIIQHREKFGPFRGIWDLMRIPGIGRKRFRRLTGLSPNLRERRDRHELLNQLLGLEPGSRPSLNGIMEKATVWLEAKGCVLGSLEGIVLAGSPGIGHDGDRYAALLPPFFRRARRPLKRLRADAARCVVLPLGETPLLFMEGDRFTLMVFLTGTTVLAPLATKVQALCSELDWLLSARLVTFRT